MLKVIASRCLSFMFRVCAVATHANTHREEEMDEKETIILRQQPTMSERTWDTWIPCGSARPVNVAVCCTTPRQYQRGPPSGRPWRAHQGVLSVSHSLVPTFTYAPAILAYKFLLTSPFRLELTFGHAARHKERGNSRTSGKQ